MEGSLGTASAAPVEVLLAENIMRILMFLLNCRRIFPVHRLDRKGNTILNITPCLES